jgi:hypothetical protein
MKDAFLFVVASRVRTNSGSSAVQAIQYFILLPTGTFRRERNAALNHCGVIHATKESNR